MLMSLCALLTENLDRTAEGALPALYPGDDGKEGNEEVGRHDGASSW